MSRVVLFYSNWPWVGAEGSTNWTSWSSTFSHARNKSTPWPSPGVMNFKPVLCGVVGTSPVTPVSSHVLSWKPADRCTFRHFYFFNNALASWRVLKHAHSSTDSSCVATTTVNTGQTHPGNKEALRVCILLFCNVQEISASETSLNTHRIKYNLCVCLFWVVQVFKWLFTIPTQ